MAGAGKDSSGAVWVSERVACLKRARAGAPTPSPIDDAIAVTESDTGSNRYEQLQRYEQVANKIRAWLMRGLVLLAEVAALAVAILPTHFARVADSERQNGVGRMGKIIIKFPSWPLLGWVEMGETSLLMLMICWLVRMLVLVLMVMGGGTRLLELLVVGMDRGFEAHAELSRLRLICRSARQSSGWRR